MTGAERQREPAEILREYGPFPNVTGVHGVTYDGRHVWFAAGTAVHALDPVNGALVRTITVAANAGTAFDGTHLFQIGDGVIQKIDPQSGRVVSTLPLPSDGDNSGLAWAEGSLWVGQYRGRKIYQLDPATGAVLRTIESDRFVTGVTWTDGELWHGTWESDESELRRIDPHTGTVLTRMPLPEGMVVTGLEADDGEVLLCGGGPSGRLRAVRRRA